MKNSFVSMLLRSRAALFGFSILLIFCLVALLAPVLPLPSPTQLNLPARFTPPTLSFLSWGASPLGTDQLGRDILSRLVHGSRITLAVGAVAVLCGGVLGVLAGLLAGYFGGVTDRIIMRIVDVQLAFPLMLLALTIIAVFGPSLVNLIIVLALTGWVRYARVVRAEVLSLREREYIAALKVAGAGAGRILLRHLLPNIMSAVLVVASLELARVIVLEAALSFLGLGIQPPFPSWGRMLSEGRLYLSSAWWISTIPGIAIIIIVLSVNLLGDWLRDVFDPKTQTR